MKITEAEASLILAQSWRTGDHVASDDKKDAASVRKVVKHKFNAVPVVIDSIRFDSKLEGRYYEHLKRQVEIGELVFFLRQVPFHLPGSTKYTVDFQLFRRDGTVAFIDVKGRVLPEFIRAKKQVEALYPVQIDIVRAGDF